MTQSSACQYESGSILENLEGNQNQEVLLDYIFTSFRKVRAF